MYFKPPVRASQRGGKVGPYLYVHIYIYTYVQITFVRQEVPTAELHPPPPCGSTPTNGTVGALLLRPKVGVQCRRRAAAGPLLLHQLVVVSLNLGQIGSNCPNLHFHLVLYHCHV